MIQQNHTDCFLARLKNDSNVVDKIRETYNDGKTTAVDFQKVCDGATPFVPRDNPIPFVDLLAQAIIFLKFSLTTRYRSERREKPSSLSEILIEP